MSFFTFGRKLDFSKEYSLQEIPLFASLSPGEQRLVEKKVRLVEYRRGDLIYEEGKPAEAFYIVVSGRFRLYLKSSGHSPERTLAYFYRGDHFGETSLLTGRVHSATVEAKRDGLILKLTKDDFLKLVSDIPAISRHLNRALGHRLTSTIESDKHRHEVKIAALYSNAATQVSFQCWLDLAATLAAQTKRKVVVVDFASTQPHDFLKEEFKIYSIPSFHFSRMEPSREADLKNTAVTHPEGFDYIHVKADEEEKAEKKLSVFFTFLSYRYDYLLLRLRGEMNDYTFRVLKQADMVYIHSSPDPSELEQSAKAVEEFQRSFGLSKGEIRVLIPEQNGNENGSYEQKEAMLKHRIFSQLPSKTEANQRYRSTLRYLAKELSGTLLGIALGSGAAYGLAHIGVLRVLERENIFPDIVAGSSIGALVGALYCAGFNADEMEAVAKSIDIRSGFFKLIGFRDFSIAHRGFFKGDQAARFLEAYLGKRSFQDLKVPLKVIAANLFTSEEVVLDSGNVVDAVRASISIPGIFRPVQHQDATLIDGGVVDPLPVRVLASLGVKKIIGVNVLPGPRERIVRNKLREELRLKKLETRPKQSFLDRLFSQGADQVSNRYAVNIFNVIMSTIQFMEYEMAETWERQADILIHPIVTEAHWAEFYSPDKFIKVGEEKTRDQIEEIRKLISE